MLLSLKLQNRQQTVPAAPTARTAATAVNLRHWDSTPRARALDTKPPNLSRYDRIPRLERAVGGSSLPSANLIDNAPQPPHFSSFPLH